MSFETVFIGLGSNLGKKEKNLERALSLLDAEIKIEALSSVYRTRAIGPGQDDFMNQVIKGKTVLDPFSLLNFLKGIEKRMGRKETFRWGPRIIDLDILLYSGKSLKSQILEIPHPRMVERRFVLEPLLEIRGNFPLGSRKSLLYYLNGTLEQDCEKK